MNLHERTIKCFWAKVDKTPASGCWHWTGAIHVNGYGQFNVGQRMVGAHRVSYELHHGALGHLFCCHRCDNRICVNPDHLFSGTQGDNVRDAVSKGRQAQGEEAGSAKLTAQQVREIRLRYANGGQSQMEIARRYGVCRESISLAVSGKTWRHLS